MVYRVQYDASRDAPRRERFANWVRGPFMDNVRSFSTEMPRDFWRGAENLAAKPFGLERVPEEESSWYRRFDSPTTFDGHVPSPRMWEEGFDWGNFRRDAAKEANTALWLAAGPAGGATAFALRAAKRPMRQMVGAATQGAINRWFPAATINRGIDSGEYAPAISDTAGWAGASGVGRLVPWLGARYSWIPKVAKGATATIGGALIGGLGGFQVSKPFAEKFGGDSNDFLVARGFRHPWNEDLVFNGQEFVFDPPPGKYPEWDRLVGRG